VVAGSGGGPDKTILRSAAGLDRSRYNAVAAYIHPTGDRGIEALRNTADRFGMQMHCIPERGPIDPKTVRMLLDLCKRLDVKIWHAHDYKTDVLGRLLRRFHDMKLISTMHGFTGETWRTRLYAKLADRALRGYDRVIAVSPLLMQHALKHGVAPDRLVQVPNAIDLKEYKRTRTREQAKYALGLAKDEHAIAIVSRFSIEKGVDRAIRLFAQLYRERPMTRLHLIGDGPQRATLEQLADDLGVTYAVRWWGWQDQTRPMLEAMDTLVLTSHTEGLPNAVLEAMALGLPVAATRVGALQDVLNEGECGVLLADTPADWAAQVLPLIDQPLLRERLLCAAWVRVSERYDFTKRMQRVQAVYDELMGAASRAQADHRRAA